MDETASGRTSPRCDPSLVDVGEHLSYSDLWRGLLIACCAIACGPAAAQTFQTTAPQALLYDVDTRSVLFEKDADGRIEPASLVKLMTAAVVFAEIEKGRLKLDDEMTVSAYAWRKGGAVSGNSAMFLTPKQRPKVSELLSGLIVVSGNDAALTLAEGISGSEENFATLMNERARDLKLKNTVLTNPTGLPDPDQRTSLRDLLIVSEELVRRFPRLYPIFAQKEFTWGKIRQVSRNPLLGEAGADGLMTGNSPSGGYGLAGSAIVNGQRLIVLVAGSKTAADRATEAKKLLDWGFRSFEPYRLFRADAVIEMAAVFGGEQSSVGLVSPTDIGTLVPRGDVGRMVATISYRGPLPAPVLKGTEVARLRLKRGDVAVLDVPLLAAETVQRGSLTRRASDAATELATGLVRRGLARVFSRGQT